MQLSLGKITCVTPGQPIRSTINIAGPAESVMVHAYSVQWGDTNKGKAYISLSPTNDRTALSKILGILNSSTPGFSAGITIELNGMDMKDVFFDFDNADDYVICSALEW
jgi:hypothetical protein